MTIDELLNDLAADTAAPADTQDIRAFAEACRRADSDPREARRISDIAGLAEAEDIIYEQALAALDRGDSRTALPLLRQCAATRLGESAYFLAGLLYEQGDLNEALTWYEQAADDGDPRADTAIAELLHADPGPDNAPVASSPAPSIAGGCPSPLLTLADEAHRYPARTRVTTDYDLPATARAGRLKVIGISEGPADAPSCWVVIRDGSRSGPRPHTALSWQCDSLPDFTQHLPCTRSELLRRLNEDTSADDWRVRLFNLSLSLPSTCAHAQSWRPGSVVLLGEPGAGKSVLAALIAQSLSGTYQEASTVPLLGTGRMWGGSSTRGQTAADVMLPLSAVPAAGPATTVHDALEQMLRSGAKAMPVVDSADVTGIITLAGLAERMHQARGLPSIQRVDTVMQPPPTVPADMPLPAVMAAAARDQDDILVVTGPDGAPAGYLTPGTLLAEAPGVRQEPASPPEHPRLIVPGPGYSMRGALTPVANRRPALRPVPSGA